MKTVMPKGEAVRQAIKWISAERTEDEKKPLLKLVQDASLRFNLSPKDEQFLFSFYSEREE